MRPSILHVNGILYWVIRTYNPDTSVLKDADFTPTVTVRKNGASVGDSVTITKRSATTGIYDCSYDPAAEVEGDDFTFEETATVTGTTTAQATYSSSWAMTIVAVERGTDGAMPVYTQPTGFLAASFPSDPADNSLIIAATDAVMTRLGAPAGASVSADIATVKTDTGNLVTRIPSALFSGITSLADWIRRISRKDAGTAGMIAAEAEIDTGGTSTFSGLTDSLEAIVDASGGGDASQTTLLAVKAKTDLIGTAQANVALTAAAVLDIGTITGFPTELIIGDSYDSDSGEIEVSILDANGDPLTAIGSLQLEDATIEFTAYRTGDPSSLYISGTCSYAASVVSISLASSATAIGKPEFTYEGRLKFIWTAEDAQKTFKTPQFKFIENP